jgi:hypothetical protein
VARWISDWSDDLGTQSHLYRELIVEPVSALLGGALRIVYLSWELLVNLGESEINYTVISINI